MLSPEHLKCEQFNAKVPSKINPPFPALLFKESTFYHIVWKVGLQCGKLWTFPSCVSPKHYSVWFAPNPNCSVGLTEINRIKLQFHLQAQSKKQVVYVYFQHWRTLIIYLSTVCRSLSWQLEYCNHPVVYIVLLLFFKCKPPFGK